MGRRSGTRSRSVLGEGGCECRGRGTSGRHPISATQSRTSRLRRPLGARGAPTRRGARPRSMDGMDGAGGVEGRRGGHALAGAGRRPGSRRLRRHPHRHRRGRRGRRERTVGEHFAHGRGLPPSRRDHHRRAGALQRWLPRVVGWLPTHAHPPRHDADQGDVRGQRHQRTAPHRGHGGDRSRGGWQSTGGGSPGPEGSPWSRHVPAISRGGNGAGLPLGRRGLRILAGSLLERLLAIAGRFLRTHARNGVGTHRRSRTGALVRTRALGAPRRDRRAVPMVPGTLRRRHCGAPSCPTDGIF